MVSYPRCWAKKSRVKVAAHGTAGLRRAGIIQMQDSNAGGMTMKKLLIGASILALGVLGASGAWANPKKAFSDNDTTTVDSNANAAPGAAYSESYNVQNEAASYQSLSATAAGLDLAGLAIPVFSGSAATGDVRDNSGVANVSPNSDTASISQQATSVATVGTVSAGQ